MDKVFISGPMSGIKDYNKPAFDAAEKKLKEAGYAVFNPAWMIFDTNGWSHEDIMKIDLAALSQCKYIYMLDGWDKSKGSKQELAYAHAIGVFPITDAVIKPKHTTRIEINAYGNISGANLDFLCWFEGVCNDILAEGGSLITITPFKKLN